jgi:microcystin-dependent protein
MAGTGRWDRDPDPDPDPDPEPATDGRVGGTAPGATDEPPPTLREAPSLQAFDDRLGSTFTVQGGDGESVPLRLTDLAVHDDGAESDWRRFSLEFDGPEGDGEGGASVLAGGTHRLDHPALDAFDVSLSPTATDGPDPGDVVYEAAFSRYAPEAGPDSLSDRVTGTSSRRGFLATALGIAAGLGLLSAGPGASVGRASAADKESYLGSIDAVGFDFAPSGWASCLGQLQSIDQNSALYSIVGTRYGGDGRTTFALPDLRGRVPIGAGRGPGLTRRPMGSAGGAESVRLTESQLPSHSHDVALPVSDEAGDARSPDGNALAAQASARGTVPASPTYTTGATNGEMAVDGSAAGGGQSVTNMSPYLTVNYVIATVGRYPSRS